MLFPVYSPYFSFSCVPNGDQLPEAIVHPTELSTAKNITTASTQTFPQ